MIFIENTAYIKEHFNESDLYIFAIGYEHRSYYFYDQVLLKLNSLNTLLFVFDDYEDYNYASRKISEIKKCNCKIERVHYSDHQDVQKKIIKTIVDMIATNDSITVHIDYSSMPRSWYCRLPILLKDVLRENDRVHFWYSEGQYPESREEYPSAGIEDFSFFSGKPSLQIDNSRVHILALGYDVVRTEAIVSITDPSVLVACYAYNPVRQERQERIKIVNNHLLSRAAMSLALRLDDFSFMVSKMCDTANELLATGDVILIPDGPKPLIFAISLVPDLLNKPGITCLHVARNKMHFKPVDVTPTGVIYGFSIRIISKEFAPPPALCVTREQCC